MSFDTFKKILNNVPKDVKVEFSGFSEAFLNKESSLMMKHAIDSGYHVELFTTLVGFSESDLNTLKNVEFDRVWFHQYDGHAQNIDTFNEKMGVFKTNIKSTHFALTMVGEQYNNVLSRAGNVFDTAVKKGAFFCNSTRLFDHNVVLPNGDVYLCCMDWSLKHNIGNLLETNFNNLNRQSIEDLAKKYDSDVLCRKCELFEERFKLPFGISLSKTNEDKS